MAAQGREMLRSRPANLLRSSQVLLRVDGVDGQPPPRDPGAIVEKLAMDLGLRGLIHGARSQPAACGQGVDKVLIFSESREGVLAREELLQRDIVHVELGETRHRVHPAPVPPRLPIDAVVVTLHRLPVDCRL